MAISESQQLLKDRTKKFTIDCIYICKKYNTDFLIFEICKQLIRSSASVGANYRAACRGKSLTDFINKLKIVVEEADESKFWLEVLKEINEEADSNLDILIAEANELISIFVASINTSLKKINK